MEQHNTCNTNKGVSVTGPTASRWSHRSRCCLNNKIEVIHPSALFAKVLQFVMGGR